MRVNANISPSVSLCVRPEGKCDTPIKHRGALCVGYEILRFPFSLPFFSFLLTHRHGSLTKIIITSRVVAFDPSSSVDLRLARSPINWCTVQQPGVDTTRSSSLFILSTLISMLCIQALLPRGANDSSSVLIVEIDCDLPTCEQWFIKLWI